MPEDETPSTTPPVAPRDPRESRHSEVDYTGGGNSHKQREAAAKKAPNADKKIEKLVTHDVVVKKQPAGQRFKHWVSLLDFGAVTRWVYKEVLLPQAKNTLYRAVSEGSERMIFRDDTISRRNLGPGPSRLHTNYSTSPPRPNPYPQDPRTRSIEARSQESRRGPTRENYVVYSREEAENIRDHLYDNLEQYEMVSVGDLRQMLGLPTEHTDYKWGWFELGRVQVRQIPEGYLLMLPPPEQL